MIQLTIYSSDYKRYNIKHSQTFMNAKRPYFPHHTDITTESTPKKTEALRKVLSPKDYHAYKMLTFVYNSHTFDPLDTSPNAWQPFEDPVPHLSTPQAGRRRGAVVALPVKRKMLCVGEIYKIFPLIPTPPLVSESSVEVILRLYSASVGNLEGLEDTLKRLVGKFAFVITEGTDTLKPKVYAARDPLGEQELFWITQGGAFDCFTTDMRSIVTVEPGLKVTPFPPGSYWDSESRSFTLYYTPPPANIITSTDPATLEAVYIRLRELLIQAVVVRIRLLGSSGGASNVIYQVPFNVNSMGSRILICILFYLDTTLSIDSFTESTECLDYLERVAKLYPGMNFSKIQVNVGGVLLPSENTVTLTGNRLKDIYQGAEEKGTELCSLATGREIFLDLALVEYLNSLGENLKETPYVLEKALNGIYVAK